MRKVHLITWIIAAAAFIYLGWTYYSRWSANRAFIGHLEESAESQDRTVADVYGGDRLTILNFYAVPAAIRRGESAQLCYGVTNAESARIEPPVKYVWPSRSRCVEVSPGSSTVYTLIAEDADGNTATADTTVEVQ
jgi:hypothetical protein